MLMNLPHSSTTNVWETHAASQTWSIMHRADYSQAQDLALEIAGSILNSSRIIIFDEGSLEGDFVHYHQALYG